MKLDPFLRIKEKKGLFKYPDKEHTSKYGDIVMVHLCDSPPPLYKPHVDGLICKHYLDGKKGGSWFKPSGMKSHFLSCKVLNTPKKLRKAQEKWRTAYRNGNRPKMKKVKKEKIENADSLDITCINLIDSANGKRPKMKKVKKEKIENADSSDITYINLIDSEIDEVDEITTKEVREEEREKKKEEEKQKEKEKKTILEEEIELLEELKKTKEEKEKIEEEKQKQKRKEKKLRKEEEVEKKNELKKKKEKIEEEKQKQKEKEFE